MEDGEGDGCDGLGAGTEDTGEAETITGLCLVGHPRIKRFETYLRCTGGYYTNINSLD